MRTLCIFSIIGVLFSITAQAAVVTYVEATDGDLSGGSSSPTDLGTFDIGINQVDAGVQDGTGLADVFTFEIATDQQLSRIILSDFDSGATVNRMFFAIHDAPTFPLTLSELNSQFTTGREFLGGLLMGSVTNSNLLPAIGAGQNPPVFIGTGFNGPLQAGQYTVLVQQTSNVDTQYTLDFAVTAVPEPSTYALIGFAMLAFCWRKRSVSDAHACDL